MESFTPQIFFIHPNYHSQGRSRIVRGTTAESSNRRKNTAEESATMENEIWCGVGAMGQEESLYTTERSLWSQPCMEEGLEAHYRLNPAHSLASISRIDPTQKSIASSLLDKRPSAVNVALLDANTHQRTPDAPHGPLEDIKKCQGHFERAPVPSARCKRPEVPETTSTAACDRTRALLGTIRPLYTMFDDTSLHSSADMYDVNTEQVSPFTRGIPTFDPTRRSWKQPSSFTPGGLEPTTRVRTVQPTNLFTLSSDTRASQSSKKRKVNTATPSSIPKKRPSSSMKNDRSAGLVQGAMVDHSLQYDLHAPSPIPPTPRRRGKSANQTPTTKPLNHEGPTRDAPKRTPPSSAPHMKRPFKAKDGTVDDLAYEKEAMLRPGSRGDRGRHRRGVERPREKQQCHPARRDQGPRSTQTHRERRTSGIAKTPCTYYIKGRCNRVRNVAFP